MIPPLLRSRFPFGSGCPKLLRYPASVAPLAVFASLNSRSQSDRLYLKTTVVGYNVRIGSIKKTVQHEANTVTQADMGYVAFGAACR